MALPASLVAAVSAAALSLIPSGTGMDGAPTFLSDSSPRLATLVGG